MSKPFKMKYTNGKKADASAFPFANQVGSTAPTVEHKQTLQRQGTKNAINKKIDEEVEKKVDEVVNQDTNEGLV